MIDYIKTVFTKPKEIYTARNMKASRYFLMILLMTITLTLISVFEVLPVFNQISDDYDEIRDFLPAYEVVGKQLESEEESYVYQTDSIVFYFDPENKMSTDIVDRNMTSQRAPISIALLDDQLYFNILNNSQSFNYERFSITANDIDNIFASISSFSFSTIIILVLVLFLLNLFLYVSQLIPITVFANLISVFRRSRLRFFQNAKIALLASVIPFILMYVLNALQIMIPYQFEIIFTTSLIIFYISITEFKNRIQLQKKDE